jgi:NitT/TauT family transport system substrate-binding protein
MAALLAVGLLVPSCGSDGGRSQPTRSVTISVGKLLLSSLAYVADARGFFAAQGLQVKMTEFVSGKLALESMLDGKADVALAGETPEIDHILRGHRLMLVTEVFRSGDFFGIVAPRDRGISSLKDLRGKKLAVPFGTAMHYFAHVALTAAGVPEREVTFVNLDVRVKPNAVRDGTVDAAAVSVPQLQQQAALLGARGITFTASGQYTVTATLATTPAYANGQSDTVTRLVRALAEAQSLVESHPQESKDLLSRALLFDRSQLERLWSGFDFRLGLDQVLLTNMEQQATWMIKTGQAKRQVVPNLLESIDPHALRLVSPASITIAGVRGESSSGATP